jgi:hypothetical protein
MHCTSSSKRCCPETKSPGHQRPRQRHHGDENGDEVLKRSLLLQRDAALITELRIGGIFGAAIGANQPANPTSKKNFLFYILRTASRCAKYKKFSYTSLRPSPLSARAGGSRPDRRRPNWGHP